MIQALLQNGFDRLVSGIVKMQRPFAGGFQTCGTKLLLQSDNPLCGAQVVQYPVRKESPDQPMTGGSDFFGLVQAPLGILELVGDRLRRHMLIDGGTEAGFLQPGMDGHQLQVVVKFNGAVRGLEPQRLVDQREWRRVRRLLELDMAVAMQLHFAPNGEQRSSFL